MNQKIDAKTLAEAFNTWTKILYAVYEPKGPAWVITKIFHQKEKAEAYLETVKDKSAFIQEIEQQCSPTWF